MDEVTPQVSRRIGNYDILGRLGQGGMAEVFRARVVAGPRAGWQVAVKRLLPQFANDPEHVDLFASEADLCKLLDHPNIVKVLELGMAGETYFMVMELVDGRDLGRILRKCKQKGIAWPLDFAVYATRVLLDALAYAHNACGPSGKPLGIVHSDVSPSNLFVSRTGDFKLGDFGVARARAYQLDDATVQGKPYYLSPEVLEGEVTQQADLWAANVTLFELLTLERPFLGKEVDEVFAAIRSRRHSPLASLRKDVSPAMVKVVEKGFAAKPSNRFQSAEEFAAALAPLYDERVGTPLAISAVVRGLFGAEEG